MCNNNAIFKTMMKNIYESSQIITTSTSYKRTNDIINQKEKFTKCIKSLGNILKLLEIQNEIVGITNEQILNTIYESGTESTREI